LGRVKRCVWSIATRPFFENHYATYPPDLIKAPITAGCPKGGIVLDPFIGSGTTAVVARQFRRQFIGIDLSPQYVRLAKNRLLKEQS
jgi:DNA modification methylase